MGAPLGYDCRYDDDEEDEEKNEVGFASIEHCSAPFGWRKGRKISIFRCWFLAWGGFLC